MVRMRIIQTLLLSMILPWAESTDVVCGKKTSETVLIGKGDSFSFKTQAGPAYQPNIKCVVKYKLRKSCPILTFFCPLFDIENKKQKCKKPDRMTIVDDGRSKHYCQKKGPNVTTSGNLQVKFVTEDSTTTNTTTSTTTTATRGRYSKFLSDESSQAAGAECVAQCFTEEDDYTTGYSGTHTSGYPGSYGAYPTYGTYTGSYGTYTGSYGTYTGSYGTYTTIKTTKYTTEGQDPSGISGVSELLRLLPLLRIPIHESVDVPGSWKSATISSDNILHDVTISYKGGRYNVLMEEVASIINIPQTLRNVKVFHHQGTKHFRIVQQGDKARRNGGMKMRVKKETKKPKKVTRHPYLISGKKMLVKKHNGKGNPYLINGKKMLVKKKGKASHKAK